MPHARRRPARILGIAAACAGCLGLRLLSLGGLSVGPPPEASWSPTVGAYLDGRLPREAPALSGGWKAVPAFPHLSFQDPTNLVPEPGGRRLYVGGRQGLIEAFENDPNASTKVTVLDLRAKCQGWDDSGLMGLAFHPGFASPGSPDRGHFYVFYNHTRSPQPGPGRPDTDKVTTNRLSRFTIPEGSAVADPASELVLIDQVDENVWHNGGGMFFHPDDGFLYLSLGDEGADYGNSQRIDRDLFGGVIRIDVDRRGGGVSHPIARHPESGTTDAYFIPDDNPWVGVPGALEEFWCLGLRSPHRMTLDPPTGRIWLGDVGDSSREEVDLVEKGANYQYNYREGTRGGTTGKPARILGREAPPVHEYSHWQGTAVIGGYTYRGAEHARDLGGKYVFGDNSGRVWALTYDESRREAASIVALCDLPTAASPAYGTGLSSFGVDHEGELYLCRMGPRGAIFRLARTGKAGVGWPRTLSATRAFRDLKSLAPRPGLVPSEVNSPFWSDGAIKSRWVAVPEGRTIGFEAAGPWSFPAGTVFVKHFEIATDEARPDAPRRRLETRFLVRDAAGSAFGATYKWRRNGSDADLLESGLTEEIAIRTASRERSQPWSYPGPRDCLQCHTTAAGYVLGVNTRQLNRKADSPLTAWTRARMFHNPPDEGTLDNLPRLVAVDDPTAGPEAKVRSYLDANCAHCHRPGGVRARFDARIEADPADGLIDAEPVNPLGVAGSRLFAPGDVSRSLLHRRLASTDPAIRMPPLARHRPDDLALAALRAWIESIPAGPRPPELRLTRPGPGPARVVAGSELALQAEALGGGLGKVEFFRGDHPIGEAQSAPYRATWMASPEGSYRLTARSTDARGRRITSPGIIVTVIPPTPPAMARQPDRGTARSR